MSKSPIIIDLNGNESFNSLPGCISISSTIFFSKENEWNKKSTIFDKSYCYYTGESSKRFYPGSVGYYKKEILDKIVEMRNKKVKTRNSAVFIIYRKKEV